MPARLGTVPLQLPISIVWSLTLAVKGPSFCQLPAPCIVIELTTTRRSTVRLKVCLAFAGSDTYRYTWYVPFGTESSVADSIEPCTPQLTNFLTSPLLTGVGEALVHTGLPDTVNARTDEAAWNVLPFSATEEPFRLMAL